MRRPTLGRRQTKEGRFSRRRQVLHDLARRGGVEITVADDSGRTLYIFVPAPDRKSRAEVVRCLADALADEAEESEDARGVARNADL